jgi:hypothetical protein
MKDKLLISFAFETILYSLFIYRVPEFLGTKQGKVGWFINGCTG